MGKCTIPSPSQGNTKMSWPVFMTVVNQPLWPLELYLEFFSLFCNQRKKNLIFLLFFRKLNAKSVNPSIDVTLSIRIVKAIEIMTFFFWLLLETRYQLLC